MHHSHVNLRKASTKHRSYHCRNVRDTGCRYEIMERGRLWGEVHLHCEGSTSGRRVQKAWQDASGEVLTQKSCSKTEPQLKRGMLSYYVWDIYNSYKLILVLQKHRKKLCNLNKNQKHPIISAVVVCVFRDCQLCVTPTSFHPLIHPQAGSTWHVVVQFGSFPPAMCVEAKTETMAKLLGN